MGNSLTYAEAVAVKRVIASAWLESASAPASATLGNIVLRPHQMDAVARIRRTLDRNRVALLADDVGLGKTYVALAVARDARRPLIVAPAALRQMWTAALAAAGITARFASYEQLSRGTPPSRESPDLVVLDEAHHVRTPGTRRYAHIATMVSRARLLLLSATPIHNARDDLIALFALVLGRAARTLDDDALASRIVRRTHGDVPVGMVPALADPEVIRIPDDEAVLQAILALPPPVPPRGAGDGGALLTWTLVRLWASTNGALRGALRRRLQRGWALSQALNAGVFPSRDELAAWQCSDAALQLAFPELLAEPHASSPGLLSAVQRHLAAIDALLHRLTSREDPDAARAEAVRGLRARSPGERILVFTQFADSAESIWRVLRRDPGVAILTSGGAKVAGGAISRAEALRRFAPVASGARPPARADAIELLIATDLLSEGVNLQDAAAVVHLDLPWTHARFAQRIGRVRRIGAPHAEVRVVTFAPPAPAERMLEIERRITQKLGAAARTIGIAGAILPSVSQAPAAGRQSPARALELLRTLLVGWRGAEPVAVPGIPVAATVRGSRHGALAAVRGDQGAHELVAILDGEVTGDPRTLLAVATLIDGSRDAMPDESAAARAIRRVARWMQSRAAERVAGGDISIESAARRATLRRLAAIVARTPITRRHETASLVARARRIAMGIVGAGGELILGQLAAAPMADDAWLRAVAAFADAHGGFDPPPALPESEPRIAALITVAGPARE